MHIHSPAREHVYNVKSLHKCMFAFRQNDSSHCYRKIPLSAMHNRDSDLDIATPRHCFPTLNADHRVRALICKLDSTFDRTMSLCDFFAFACIYHSAINHFLENDACTGWETSMLLLWKCTRVQLMVIAGSYRVTKKVNSDDFLTNFRESLMSTINTKNLAKRVS